MQIPKPSEDDKQFMRSLVADDERVEVKRMFGNLGAFVNGNMFAGLFGSAVGVRLDEDGRAELAAVEGSGPFGPAERRQRRPAAILPGQHSVTPRQPPTHASARSPHDS